MLSSSSDDESLDLRFFLPLLSFFAALSFLLLLPTLSFLDFFSFLVPASGFFTPLSSISDPLAEAYRLASGAVATGATLAVFWAY